MSKSPLIRSFGYAFKGFKFAMAERNFRLHLIASTLVIILGLWVNISPVEWCVIIICMTGVVALELMNTAIEHLVNLVSPDYHDLAGRIKDLAAAAVLCLSIGSFIIALIIFLPRLIALVN